MIYILAPTRNRKELTKKFLESLMNQTYKEIKVVLVDDGSTDGTREMVKEIFPEVTVLEGDGNLWWTGAMRVGVDNILPISKEGDYILVQNDDTYMERDFLKELRNLSESNGRMIMGTTVIDIHTNEVMYNSHRLIKGYYRPTTIEGTEEIIDTDTISGRGVLVPIEVFVKIGNFSKLFPHYAADYDFQCRAKKAGFKLGVARNIYTYSTVDKPGLAKRVMDKRTLSFKDMIDIFFHRRSSSNLPTSYLFTLINVPFPTNIYGICRIFANSVKIILVNFLYNNLMRVPVNEK